MNTDESGIIKTLSTLDVAKALGVSPESVRRAFRAGQLKALPHTGTKHLRFTVAAVNEYIMKGNNE